ncbi:ABC transporter permease [Aestuariivirga sp.]|uniref:ABC transporter permease n=1 Tax=Aestuariivirga sp. TaxID=2650926 RepID=UPI00359408F2
MQRTVTSRWLGVAPAWFVIGIFGVLPMFIMLAISFMVQDPYGGVDWGYSHEAYIQFLFERDLDDSLILNPIYINIVMRSIGLAAMTTVLCLIVGLPVAYFIARQPEDKRNLFMLLITIPFWTNLLIRTYAWILILTRNGVVDARLQWFGFEPGTFDLLYTNTAIFIGLVYSYLPFMVLPLYASLEKMDFRLVEAASDLYASKWQAARHVILPLAKPGIVAGSLLVFIPSIGAFIAPELLGGGKRMMLGSLIYFQFATARNWPFGAAVSILLMAFVMIALLVYARASKGQGLPAGGH